VGLPSGYLAFINGALAAFNLLPAFPLDGGRVFRSIIWARNRDILRATRTAARVAEYVAYGLMVAGAAQILFHNLVGGVWTILIGVFLHGASAASYQQMVEQKTLQGVTAGEVASTAYDPVPPDMTVAQLVEEHVLTRHGRYYPVSGSRLLLEGVAGAGGTGRPMLGVGMTSPPRSLLAVVEDDLDGVGARLLDGSGDGLTVLG